MRKILTVILIPIFILTATVGITQTSYSCKGMGEGSMVKPCCGNTGKGGCCEKKSIILKIQDVFIKNVSNSSLTTSLFIIHEQNYVTYFAPVFENSSYSKDYWENAPPPPLIGFYILYSSLII
jgi:hypothetical protein